MDPDDEVLVALRRLIDQAADPEDAPTARIAASIAAGQYLEALTRSLVDEAREQGATWEAIGEAFGTSPQNVRARFGSYRDYDD